MSAAALKPENYKYALTDLDILTQVVIDKYHSRYGVILEPEEVMSVYGSQEGIAHIGLSLVEAGDIVLAPDPGYPVLQLVRLWPELKKRQ